jgi:hypothetical protein
LGENPSNIAEWACVLNRVLDVIPTGWQQALRIQGYVLFFIIINQNNNNIVLVSRMDPHIQPSMTLKARLSVTMKAIQDVIGI